MSRCWSTSGTGGGAPVADEREYPQWICYECGIEHGRRTPGLATWHLDTCDVCGKNRAVTEPRDFGHLKDTWLVAEKTDTA